MKLQAKPQIADNLPVNERLDRSLWSGSRRSSIGQDTSAPRGSGMAPDGKVSV
jgi:hypothetical protein